MVAVIVGAVIACCALGICLWYFSVFSSTEQQKAGVMNLGQEMPIPDPNASADGASGDVEMPSQGRESLVGMETVRDSISGGGGNNNNNKSNKPFPNVKNQSFRADIQDEEI